MCRNKALVVGLNDYPDCRLNWCDNDAEELGSLLEFDENGHRNFDVRVIKGKATASELEKAVGSLFSGEADVALLYFSGHGMRGKDGCLVTTDYDHSSRSYGLRMSDVIAMVNKSMCRNKVLILDCCYSGKMGNFDILGENEALLKSGVTIMSACLPYEESAEDDEIKHGVFTNLLIEGLRGEAADIQGRITPASLYSFIDQTLGAWEQRPVFKTYSSEFIPLRRVNPKVPADKLQKLKMYFGSENSLYHLDPSFEDTNTPYVKHEVVKPYADAGNVAVFKDLQLFTSAGLVEPVGEEHMYFAAMHSRSCRLTKLGMHYWKLAQRGRL